MKQEFGVVRREFREEIRANTELLRDEMRAGDEALRVELRAELRAGHESLEQTIEEGDAETRRYMRVLYEDLAECISTISDGK